MGKKNKDDIPVSNRDILQRLNFLYQASVLLNGISHRPSFEANDAHIHPKKRTNRVVSTADLSRSYVETMKVVGQKTNVKIDPTVKRVICKGCNIVLLPGASSTMRVKKSKTHGHLIIQTCNSCRTSRRLPAPETSPPAPEAAAGSASLPAYCAQTRQKKPHPTCLPPHFARDLGHVVFRGNERLLDAIL